MDDVALARAWLRAELGRSISHEEHVRIAFVLLRDRGGDGGIAAIHDGTRANSAALGAPERYDAGLTQRWAEAIAAAADASSAPDGDTFLREHPELLDGSRFGAPAWQRENRNRELVRRLFDAFERKDAFVLRELFAEDAVWTVGGSSAIAGVYRGRRAIVRFLGTLPRLTAGTYRSRPIDVLASAERAAVLYRATGEREGRRLDLDQLLLFTVRDDAVAEVLALPGDQAAFDVFWGA